MKGCKCNHADNIIASRRSFATLRNFQDFSNADIMRFRIPGLQSWGKLNSGIEMAYIEIRGTVR